MRNEGEKDPEMLRRGELPRASGLGTGPGRAPKNSQPDQYPFTVPSSQETQASHLATVTANGFLDDGIEKKRLQSMEFGKIPSLNTAMLLNSATCTSIFQHPKTPTCRAVDGGSGGWKLQWVPQSRRPGVGSSRFTTRQGGLEQVTVSCVKRY